MHSLVIVESPAKAKTIGRFLGPEYTVEASYGHVRDLPEKADQIPPKLKKEKWARLGVNIEHDFEPLYVVPEDKKKHVARLKKALKDADELLLATDEDREGESICWHLVQELEPKQPTKRIAFHEITKGAILQALENPRAIDDNLVRAQESRRILDRLFGYLLSPVLWKKVRRGLSAGRVQSVAVRLCVLRELERRVFNRANYCGIEAEFATERGNFTARMVRIGDRKLATGSDFDETTGILPTTSSALWLRTEADAEQLIASLARPFTVRRVDERPQLQGPPPPFTTATLQQEANRKLGFSARHTMRLAQRLYEGVDVGGDRLGLITYMRTDSVTLAESALTDAARVVEELYGATYTIGPRRYRTQSAGAQEAHEAIRPTEIGRTAQSLEAALDRDELRLYEMICKRTVASQMADARLQRTAVELATTAGDRGEALFNASGKRIEFPGFLRAYVEGSDDPAAEIADREMILPPLTVGQQLDPARLLAQQHETTPPARYTEATLVKKLEAEGIGRPSTYATIIDTIQERGYIQKQGKALTPTFTAVAVTQLLEKHFNEYVDVKFTARMEQQLDEVAAGQLDWLAHLRRFYHGADDHSGLEQRIAKEEPSIDFPSIELGTQPESGAKVAVRIGRYGPYLQLGSGNGDGQRLIAPLPPRIAPADLTLEQALELIEAKQRGPLCLGPDPATGLDIFLVKGRFGPYVQLGPNPTDEDAPKPKRASLPKGVVEESVTLELALTLLSLPRSLGVNPEGGEEVIASVSRFGPFVKCGTKFRSLEATDDVYQVELARALELLAQPAKKRSREAPRALRELGLHPDSGTAVQLINGRYGPYVTDGKRNASLPQGSSPDELNLDEAVRLLAQRGREPKRKRARAS